MATYYFTGKCKWARLQKPDDKYKKYSIDVELADEVQQKEYSDLKLKGKIKDGYVSFSSYPDKKKGGPAQQPLVVDMDGKPLSELVGNDSEVTVKIETYSYNNEWGKGNGHRLVGVKVNKLVVYDGEAAAKAAPGAGPKVLF